jgi:hypothetical protein
MRLRLHTSLGQTIGAELIALPCNRRMAPDSGLRRSITFRDISGLDYDAINLRELASARSSGPNPRPATA